MQAPILHGINIEIARQLDEMAEMNSSDRYRKQAYSKAAANIRKLPYPITSGQQAKDAGIGVGDSTKAKIDEILQTGQIQALRTESTPEKLKRDAVKLFKTIHGVGGKQAEKWYDANYRTLQDLIPLYQSGQMTAAQQLGVQYYSDLQLKVPRVEIQAYETGMHNIFDPLQIEFVIAGSYRRGLPESGDIDVLMKYSDMTQIIHSLKATGVIVGNLTPDANVKSMLIVKIGANPARRMDIRLIPKESWPFALLYFTGSKNFNIVIRDWALSKGLSLSEYGFSNVNAAGALNPEINSKIHTEQDIFTFLGLQYQPPEERSDTVQLKPIGAVPKDVGQWFRPNETVLAYTTNSVLLALNTPGAKKIAGFDLDKTIIHHKSGNVYATHMDDIEILPRRLPILKSLIAQGYILIIFTNQKSTTDKKRENTFAKLQHVVKLLDLPVLLIAALGSDEFRKPGQGMWNLAEQYLKSVDWKSSFFCGDAAGRSEDHADSDLKFAQTKGVRFFIPEEIFRLP